MSTRSTRIALWLLACVGVMATIVGALARAHVAPRPTALQRVTVERTIMSTQWRVILPAHTDSRATAAAGHALDEVKRLEGVLSEWRPGTEVSRINDAAGVSSVAVGEDTWAVVSRSLRIAALSGGAFDPTWAALRGLWNFHATHPAPPRDEDVRARLPLVDWRLVQMDARARTIRLARRGMALGFGGIAKGYALDRAAARLRAEGENDFMLDAGGQVMVHGTNDGQPWRVGIRDPRDDDGLIGTVEITSGSLSSSGDYESFFEYEGRRYHHILDPRTGFPVTHTIAVSVIAEDAMDADAFSTALFVMEPEPAMALADALGLAALRVGPDSHVEMTPAMRRLLHPIDSHAPVYERIR